MGGAVACKKIEEVMACVNNTTGTLGHECDCCWDVIVHGKLMRLVRQLTNNCSYTAWITLYGVIMRGGKRQA